jgi:exopolysaccharide biosynthesis predicted pyruvyltransferase EpsI
MPEKSVFTILDALPKNETIYYRSNPGNAGDALIASGAYKLFDKAGLKIELVDPATFNSKDKIVIYAGGGNLVGIYPEARDFFFKHHKTAKQLILLPHTVTKNEDLLSELGSNVTLFAREEVTYQHLKKHAKNTNVYLNHDLALHLNVKEILSSKTQGIFEATAKKLIYSLSNNNKRYTIPSPKIMLKNSIYEGKSRLRGNNKVGTFFRDDVEASGRDLPPNNADLSTLYEYGTQNRELTDYTVTRLMRHINKFERIRTDRLHICIAAALLGKEVDFHPNSYFKCKAVYEYSLKENFPSISWKPV